MSQAFALVACLAGIAAILASSQSGVWAQSPATAIGEHPRLPSQPRLSRDLIFEDGAPRATASRRVAADPATIGEGRTLYDTHCVSCHGADLRGSTGIPSLMRAGGAAVDFYVSTGRMPDASKSVQAVHTAPHFTRAQIDALDAYVSSIATTRVPIPDVVTQDGLLQHGRHLFEANCQACHGAAAEGAIVGGGYLALPLYQATPTQIGEAIRIGPGPMPRFTTEQLSSRDIDAIATYVGYLTVTSPSYGGLTMDYLGAAAEGLVGGLLGVGALFWVIYFTGTKADGTRLNSD